MTRFKKLVEEKLRNWEFQPDMFDLDAGVSYADGVQSFNFIDIDDYISAHFPQLEFQGMREKEINTIISKHAQTLEKINNHYKCYTHYHEKPVYTYCHLCSAILCCHQKNDN